MHNMNIQVKGYTVIELMVTVAILAVITSIAIPMYSGYIQSANRAECGNEVAAIELALSEFFLENNRYFNGANAAALQASSGGLYTASPDALAPTANCTYAVAAGATADINTSFQINAIGQGDLAGVGCVLSKPDPTCP